MIPQRLGESSFPPCLFLPPRLNSAYHPGRVEFTWHSGRDERAEVGHKEPVLIIVILPLEMSCLPEEVPMSLEWLNCTLVSHTRKSVSTDLGGFECSVGGVMLICSVPINTLNRQCSSGLTAIAQVCLPLYSVPLAITYTLRHCSFWRSGQEAAIREISQLTTLLGHILSRRIWLPISKILTPSPRLYCTRTPRPQPRCAWCRD